MLTVVSPVMRFNSVFDSHLIGAFADCYSTLIITLKWYATNLPRSNGSTGQQWSCGSCRWPKEPSHGKTGPCEKVEHQHLQSKPIWTVFKTTSLLHHCVVEPALYSVPDRCCQRSWVAAPGPWTWSWRPKSRSSVKTRKSTSTWSGWLRCWPVSWLRWYRHRSSWAMPSLTWALSHRNSTWVSVTTNIRHFQMHQIIGCIFSSHILLSGWVWLQCWHPKAPGQKWRDTARCNQLLHLQHKHAGGQNDWRHHA